MSWYINVVGSPEEIKQVAANAEYLPAELKAVVAVFADANAKDKTPAVMQLQLRTNGHYWADGQCGVSEFSLTQAPSEAKTYGAKPEAPAIAETAPAPPAPPAT